MLDEESLALFRTFYQANQNAIRLIYKIQLVHLNKPIHTTVQYISNAHKVLQATYFIITKGREMCV